MKIIQVSVEGSGYCCNWSFYREVDADNPRALEALLRKAVMWQKTKKFHNSAYADEICVRACGAKDGVLARMFKNGGGYISRLLPDETYAKWNLDSAEKVSRARFA